jgi:8-hydroxy-5-deazaflavin:NADPH oxidoreductase
MATVGLIGSGHIGSTVARLAIDAGHDVVLSNSRGPQTLRDLTESLGPRARAATGGEAAAAGDFVVVTIPVKAYPLVPAAALAGKVVLDTGNYYPPRDGQIPELADMSLTSSEYLGRLIPGADVVKVFNNIFFKHLLNLSRPAGAADRSCLPIAANGSEQSGAAAKETVSAFLDSIGWDALDYGPLAESWRQQPGTPVYGAPYGSIDDEKGTPAGTGVIRAALAAATR